METESIPTAQTKVCTKCGVEYPATREYFYANKKYKFGVCSACKKCKQLETKKWRDKNPEKYLSMRKKRYVKNSEKRKATAKKYYAENTEKNLARSKNWRHENPEKSRASTRNWQNKNPEKVQYIATKNNIKKQIGAPPPPELVEIKVLINKTKRLCKTLKN